MAASRTVAVVIAIPLGEDDDPEEIATKISDKAGEADVPNRRLGVVSYVVEELGARATAAKLCARPAE